MQTAQLIKMICAISNYPTNTMQTSREAYRGFCCLELFPGAQHLWENRRVCGGQTPGIYTSPSTRQTHRGSGQGFSLEAYSRKGQQK